MKKLILLIGVLGLLLVGCGKSKIKTYTLAEKEAYLEKANNGDKEAEKFIKDKMDEANKIYKESSDSTANKEYNEWAKVYMKVSSGGMPIQQPSW